MPSVTEQIFRYTFLYSGIYFLCIGTSSVIQGFFTWKFVRDAGFAGDTFLVLLTLILVYGSPVILGVIIVTKFRQLATWAVRQISEQKAGLPFRWYDLVPFSITISVLVGLYYLSIGIKLSRAVWVDVVWLLGSGKLSWTSPVGETIHSVQGLMIPVLYLSAGVVFLVFCGKIGKMVEKTVLQTENADLKDSDPDPVEVKDEK